MGILIPRVVIIFSALLLLALNQVGGKSKFLIMLIFSVVAAWLVFAVVAACYEFFLEAVGLAPEPKSAAIMAELSSILV